MHHPLLRPVCVWGVGALLLGLSACVNPQVGMQPAVDTERDKDLEAVRTIGSITEVGNVLPIQVSGVGLVTGLEGTGGSPPGMYRKMLEEQMRKAKVENVKQWLDSPDSALVLVSALMPAGCRKGDPLDVEVTLPPGSKATSLRGGVLQYTTLRSFDTTKSIKPDYKGADRLLLGNVLAHAKGTLIVGLGNADDPAEVRRARIWGGGVSHLDRPFGLYLKKDKAFAAVSSAIADKINFVFQDDPQRRERMLKHQHLLVLDEVTQQINQKFGGPALERTMARALDKSVVQVNVPYPYRYNVERYLLVARLLPLQESPETMGKYRARLHKMLFEPQETVRAALRLEALGKESAQVLRQGLAHEHALVRFASAEALTYLGQTAGVEELGKLIVAHAEFRAHGLKALASLDEAVTREALGELLASSDAEVRCGAFRALRLLDDRDPRLGAENLQAFWVHRVAPSSTPLVHFMLRQRAEIVLFGDDIVLTPPVRILAGPNFTVTAEANDGWCTVTRFVVAEDRELRRQCSLKLEDVLRTMAEMGGQYADAVDLLRKAEDRRCLSCPVRVNTLPDDVAVETLAEAARNLK